MAVQKYISILLFLIIFLSIEIKAQTEIVSPVKNLSELDEKPDFPGGIQEFYKFIRDNY